MRERSEATVGHWRGVRAPSQAPQPDARSAPQAAGSGALACPRTGRRGAARCRWSRRACRADQLGLRHSDAADLAEPRERQPWRGARSQSDAEREPDAVWRANSRCASPAAGCAEAVDHGLGELDRGTPPRRQGPRERSGAPRSQADLSPRPAIRRDRQRRSSNRDAARHKPPSRQARRGREANG